MADSSSSARLPLQYEGTRSHRLPTWVGRVGLLLTGYPLVMLAGLYGTWLAAWVSLGHMPQPSLDDPLQINGSVTTLHFLAVSLLVLMPAAWVCGSVCVAADMIDSFARRRPKRLPLVTVVLYVAAWVATITLLRQDPWDVGVWLMD